MVLQLPRRTLSLDAPVVMGILNVTPDSFSDGGRHRTVGAALQRAREMIGEGAGIIDVGGESTRPGSAAVGESEEIDRVVPVVEAIRRELDVVISIDTMKPAVMRAACAAGAELINDVYALQAPGALDVAREAGAAVCLMHMQGQPKTMQQAPHYDDVLAEVRDFLAERVAACEQAGIPRSRLCVDPGIGFGKRLEHNLALLARVDALAAGLPVLIGVSRKTMFGELLGRPVGERLPGALAVAAIAVWQGAAIVRVHDVRATADAIRVAQALREFRKAK
ncbi:dihydropteroate synthase [Solimonas flava]|uniref:dihydropteroate synthase n=1 Tax=Solimonas flava TaxID=415849 RepID=UPI00040ED3AD|nr:dihydropteroate synthase [Solimonas flava]